MKRVFALLMVGLLAFAAAGQAQKRDLPEIDHGIKDILGNIKLPDAALPRVIFPASQERVSGVSRFEGVTLNPAKIEDLAALGRVWGFLKYHHPAVAAGNYNWDQELFRMMPEIMAAPGRFERNEILSRWIDSLGNFPLEANQANPAETKLNPDLLWIDPRVFGNKLAKKLTLIKNAGRTGVNRYVGMTASIGNPVFQNEEIYASMPYPPAEIRLLALFRYWSVIQYFFPNRHLIGENWNGVMTEFTPRFWNAANELDYKRACLALIGRIHDTHANVWGIDNAIQTEKGQNATALRIRFVEDKAVVTDYWNQTLGAQTGLVRGDVIETVNGKTVAELISERLEYYPASNYTTKLRDIGVHLLRTNDATLNVTYRRNGIVASATLATYPWLTTIDLNLVYYRPIPPFNLIGTDIAYLYPGSLQANQIYNFIPQIAATRGLVIDLRCYPSDYIVYSLGAYIVPQPTNFVIFSAGSVMKPGLFTLRTSVPVGVAGGPDYTGKVVILVNELTQSQAEFTAMAFRAVPGAVVIGSTTAGADGNVSQFYLPGAVSTMISGLGVYYPDGRETQRVGIVPDIVAKPTIQGVKDGRDEVLERAVQYINAN